jgi:hypothetical protein
MGSEMVVWGYGILGFLCLIAFLALFRKGQEQRNQEDVNKHVSLEKKIDPFTFLLQLLFLAGFVFSMIGMAKGVVESYDYCEILAENMTEVGNLTTVDYSRVCFTNAYEEDENLFELSYFILYLLSGLFIIGAVWQLFLFIKDQVWYQIKNKFFGRRK